MDFPTNSLGAFIAGFGVVHILCIWLSAYVLGWSEAKWSPGFNLSLDSIFALIVIIPLAAISFSIGAYLVNAPRDPWHRTLVGGVLLAVIFFFATRLAWHIESEALGAVAIWGTLILGAASVGVFARLSARAAA